MLKKSFVFLLMAVIALSLFVSAKPARAVTTDCTLAALAGWTSVYQNTQCLISLYMEAEQINVWDHD